MNTHQYFANRQLIIATKHGKEKAIAPVVESGLGVKTFISENLDTDVLGTFTGEIERKNDPLTTLRKKCQMAMEIYKCDLCIATEGSFGPHPSHFFMSANDELAILVDKKHGFEILVRELSMETNFSGSKIESQTELEDFACRTSFPSHALIVRDEMNSNKRIVKGITDREMLMRTFEETYQTFGTAYVETDMRAFFNPKRMKTIAKAAEKLVAKANTFCPACLAPGFGVSKAKNGLPCKICCTPTESTLYHVYECIKCNYSTRKMFPYGITAEDPMYCIMCNP